MPSLPIKTREYRLPKIDGFHNLTLQEAPIGPLKSTEVLVRVHAVSLQYRDLVVAKGQYPLAVKENPIPGSDMAGEILAIGDDVMGWAVGDQVYSNFATGHIYGDTSEEIKRTGLGAHIDGVLSEYKILPAHALVRIPSGYTYEEASTLPCAAGTGGVSIFGLQFAVASGATVIATSSSDEKLQIAKRLGAKHLINYKTTPGWDEEVLKITNGRGVDYIIEVGGAGTLPKSLKAIRYGGIISVIGFVAGVGDVSTVPRQIASKAATVRGILVGPRTHFENMNRLIEATGIKPVIDNVFTFEELRSAYEYLESQKHAGKIVVKVAKD